MEKFAVDVLFLTAIALPIVLFLLFRPRSRWSALLAAAISIAAGWSFNLAYVIAAQAITADDPSETNGAALAMAATFGWVCPAVLVALTWLVWRFKRPRAA